MPATRTDPVRSRAGRLAGLYAITPERGDADALVAAVRAAIDGGIDASNAGSVIEAGASAVAVISAVFDADDVAAAAARIARECEAGARRRAGLPSRYG